MNFLRTIKGLVSRYAFLVRLCVTGLLMITIPMLMLSAQNHRNRSDVLNHSHQTQCEAIALAVCDQMKEYIESLYTLSYRVHEQMRILYQQRFPSVSQEMELLRNMNILSSGYPFLTRMGVYLPYNEEVIYLNTGKYDFDIFARVIMNSPALELKAKLSSPESFFMGWNQSCGLSGYGIPLFFYSDLRASGVAIYMFSHSSITAAMKAIMPAECLLYSITSPQGERLFYSELLGEQYTPGTASFEQVNLSGNAYFFISVTSKAGYGCQLMIPENHLTSFTNQYSSLSGQYFVITLMLSLLVLVLMSAINYMPLYRLLRSVLGVRQNTRSQNEFTALQDTYQSQLKSHQQMRKSLRQERQWLIEHIYDCLLCKTPVSQEKLKILYQYMPRYVVACVLVDDHIMQMVEEHSNDLLSPVHVLNSNSYPFLVCRVNSDNEEGRQQAVENIRSLVGDAEIAVSTVSNNLQELYLHYQEARNALKLLHRDQRPDSMMENEVCKSQIEERDQTDLKIIRFVEQNFTDPSLSVIAVAEELGTSEYTAGRLIRRIYGPGFRRVINEKRLAYAKTLLSVSEYSIADVSRLVGFLTPSYFIKLFKQFAGSTPAQYRDMIMQIEQEDESLFTDKD